MRIEAVLHPAKEGGYAVSIPAFDLWTQGETKEECYMMAREAVTLAFESEIGGTDFTELVEAHPEEGDVFTLTVPEQEALQMMIKLLRASQGFSLGDASKALGSSSKNSFAQYEQGAREPGVTKLAQLLDVLHYDLVLSVRTKKTA